MRSGEAMDGLLELQDVTVTYERLIDGIHDIDVRVASGEIVGILGANGAGKSTTLRAISGFMRSEDAAITKGDVRFRGESIVGRGPGYVARQGISLIPEQSKIFRSLTVDENLRSVVSHADAIDFSTEDAYSTFPPLRDRRKQVSGYLSGGERQMLAIAMAMLMRPALLLADELSVGVSPLLLSELLGTLSELNRTYGTAILLVEQNANAAMSVAERVYVLENGRVVVEGETDELARRPDFRELYLGVGSDASRRRYTESELGVRRVSRYG